MRRAALLAGAATAVAIALPSQAAAVDHLYKIKEVFAGTTGAPTAEFIELQAHLHSQNQLAGNQIEVYDAAGALIATTTFPSNLSVGVDQSTVLVATPKAESFFGVDADVALDSTQIPASGGKVCYVDVDDPTAGVRDCVSFGAYTAGAGSGLGATGTPLGQTSGGIPNGFSIVRDTSGGSNPTALDTGDDTNNSDADFDVVGPTPTNNAGATTATAGTVGVSAGSLTAVAASGVVNKLIVKPNGAGTRLLVSDTAAPVIPSSGCSVLLVNVVRCVASVATVALHGGDLNDRLQTQVATASGSLLGGDGSDALFGGGAADALSGESGNDAMTGGGGPDVLAGGAGVDTGKYDDRSSGVEVDLDDVADDGSALDEATPGGDRDDVTSSTEAIVGGSGNDVLTGSNAGNKLVGNLGEDALHGLGGNDKLEANDGLEDQLTCGAGAADHVFTDALDIFPNDGTCELVN